MKLSEAILIGAAKRPQAFGDYIEEVSVDGSRWDFMTHTCALGAAFEAITGELPGRSWIEKRVCRTLRDTCGLAYKRISHPEVGRGAVLNVVSRLNDDRRWTREQIAAWLAERDL